MSTHDTPVMARSLKHPLRHVRIAMLLATMALAACSGASADADAAGHGKGWSFGGQYGVMAGDPSLFVAAGDYRMYYSCYATDLGGTDICLATSKDGLHWDMPKIDDGAAQGRVLFATRKGWDGAHETPEAVRVGNETWLYTVAYTDARTGFFNNTSQLALARSTDGLHFRLHEQAVLSPLPGGPDDHGITSPTVIRDAHGWSLVYTGWCLDAKVCPRAASGRFTTLLGATSSDGLHWTRREAPLLEDSALPTWASSGIAETHVVRAERGQWVLLFTALSGDAPKSIGIATGPSPFGPWTIEAEPLLPGAAIGDWADKGPVAPYGTIEGGRLRMWYAGEDSHGPAFRVGYAEFSWPRH